MHLSLQTHLSNKTALILIIIIGVNLCMQGPMHAMAKSPITTHVLDTALGRPAAGVPVQLSFLEPNTQTWTPVMQA